MSSNPDNVGMDALRRHRSLYGTQGRVPKFGNDTIEDSYLYHLGDSTNPRLGFGGSSAAFPSLKRVGALFEPRLADDSARSAIIGGVFATSKPAVDAKVAATTAIFTTANEGRDFVATGAHVEATTITTHVEVASLSIGSDAEVDNILAITALTGVVAAGIRKNLPLGLFTKVAPNTVISVKITTPADAEAAIYTVTVLGYYE